MEPTRLSNDPTYNELRDRYVNTRKREHLSVPVANTEPEHEPWTRTHFLLVVLIGVLTFGGGVGTILMYILGQILASLNGAN